MKKALTLSTAIALATVVSTSTYANGQRAEDARHISTIAATTVAGALAGGPIGMFFGAIGGAFLVDKNQKNFEEKISLAEEVNSLEQSITTKELAIISLENRVAKKLEFQVMFPTGDDTIAFQDIERIKSLAKYLQNNPDLRIRLDGHADPRGTDEYNNVLSSERAKAVAATMVEHGIDETRINLHAHGSSLATTIGGNRDQYAFERRVHIEVYSENGEIASNP
ncbi:MAG: OmpA family protein [Agarilytica sp.]